MRDYRPINRVRVTARHCSRRDASGAPGRDYQRVSRRSQISSPRARAR